MSSCKKDKLITDTSAKVRFSADSVLFDTVFTTLGSATRNIRVINPYKQKIKISAITLVGGINSQFIVNVDGAKGRSFNDIEIAANDSMFIFIQVNVNPTNSNSPLVINDQLQFVVNGNIQTVTLEAWGQDAYYHKPTNAIKYVQGGYLAYSTVANTVNTTTTVTWPNDKPHVIYGWLVVDSLQTLVIDPGVKVYFHQNAGLWVYPGGTLKAKGTKGNEIIFQGDRLETAYSDTPGQWDRIWINEGSMNNELDYCIIKNGYIGVQAELLFRNPNINRYLKITNTIIRNMSKWGLYALDFNIYGGNNVICNCKEYCAALTWGGSYKFYQTTFTNFWTNDSRTLACVHIDNHNDTQVIADTCVFGNCIIDGNISDELETDLKTTNLSALPQYTFSYCFLRTANKSSDAAHYTGNVFNGITDFIHTKNYNFHLGPTSGAANMPNAATANASLFPQDLDGTFRLPGDGMPDAGAYER